MDLTPLLTSRTVAAIGLACIALSALAALWAMVKLSYQRALGKPMPRNALTMTLDVIAELATNVVGAVSRAIKLGTGESLFKPTVPLASGEVDLRSASVVPPEPIVPHDPTRTQRGSVELGALSYVIVVIALAVAVVGGITAGCTPPTPPSDGGVPVVTPSDWTRTAHLSVTVGRGLIVVARPIVDALTVDPGQTRARRAFDAADDALVAVGHALDAYEARGGDRCAAYAATGAAVVALHELAQVLADNGIAIGVPIGRVIDLVASVADTLVPACQADAGFASVGQRANDELRAIEQGARVRGVILRRDLDGIAPALDGGVR